MAFNPWSYDANKDCYISMSEAMAAVNDYNYGVITQSQSLQVVNLWQNGTRNPACEAPVIPGAWVEVGHLEFTLTSPAVPGFWVEVGSLEFTLTPPAIPGFWVEVGELEFVLTPKGFVPTCSVDADCPENEVCTGGKCVCAEGYARNESGICVKKGAFPWQWLAIAGAAIAGVILLIPRPKKAKEK